jgi:hypothetical protein
MAISDDVSYFSRFLVKFVEIIAAGFATAASGYLIAHLSGALSSPAPPPAAAVIQVIPSTSMVSGSLPAQPTPPPISANIKEQRLAPEEVNAPRVAQPAHRTLNTTTAQPPSKHMESTTDAAESTRDQKSFLARVRAALATVDANRTDRHDVSPQQRDVKRAPAVIVPPIAPPRPVTDQSGAPVTTPGGAEFESSLAHEAAPNPLTAVEIKSHPLGAVQSLPVPPTDKDPGVFSALEQMLRHDPLAAADEAPRPPMPIGQ